MTHRSLPVLVLLLLLIPMRSSGQSPQALRICVLYGSCPPGVAEAAPSHADPFPAAVQDDSVSTTALYAAGLLGGAVGMFAAGAAGYYLVDRPSGSWIPAMTILGGLVGEGVGVPLGVHLANGRKGNVLLPLIVSPVLAVAAPFLASVIPIRETVGAILIGGGIVALQLYTSVRNELATSP